MARHGRPPVAAAELVPGTLRVISVRMAALAPDARRAADVLADGRKAYVARYALGAITTSCCAPARRACAPLEAEIGPFGYRAFVDFGSRHGKAARAAMPASDGSASTRTSSTSAPARSSCSGELFTDLPLPVGERAKDRCGSCSACLPACPPARSRRPTSSTRGAASPTSRSSTTARFPEPLRSAIGNRVFGCETASWSARGNKFARAASEPDFRARHGLDAPELVELVRMERAGVPRQGRKAARCGGSAIAAGCATLRSRSATHRAPRLVQRRSARARTTATPSVREHVAWALAQQEVGADRVDVVPAARRRRMVSNRSSKSRDCWPGRFPPC
jgi:epoxyqueuosine reductase